MLVSCVGVTGTPSNPGGGNGGGGGGTGGNPPPSDSITGSLTWKGDVSRSGNYSSETKLTPANISATSFGKLGSFQGDGLAAAQPLYVTGLDMGTLGVHNVIIFATEHDSVYALDADNLAAGPLWAKHYVDTANGITTLPDNFGGRTTLGGEVGITGTPVIDPSTGALYFVTVLQNNGVAEQWLRAIDIRTGNDFGAGKMKIQASVAGDGKGSANGQIAFDPSIQDQRSGLSFLNGSVIVPWGSFSDWGVYHGWLMAFDGNTLNLQAVFNPTPQAQAVDDVSGPADHGGGGAFWQGGAAPAIDAAGNIYANTADGSFNANQGGNNYGDTMLKLQFNGSSFQIVDSFTPFNQACINESDLEIGSVGVAVMPNSTMLLSGSKEGRFYMVNSEAMGNYDSTGDNHIVQEFMIGEHSCDSQTPGSGAAEGTGWNRMYGTPAFWNNNMYAQPSSLPLKQYKFQNGTFNPTPVSQSPTSSGLRGGNSVVSSNGNQNGIVWTYEKTATGGRGILHAYDAMSVSTELWNSSTNA
ncbi:MAG TPA: hypothetical protein VLK33_01970, partial [Terriglobales bacterium]|nr:hypothetical protein [Terriglobales bacterium]